MIPYVGLAGSLIFYAIGAIIKYFIDKKINKLQTANIYRALVAVIYLLLGIIVGCSLGGIFGNLLEETFLGVVTGGLGALISLTFSRFFIYEGRKIDLESYRSEIIYAKKLLFEIAACFIIGLAAIYFLDENKVLFISICILGLFLGRIIADNIGAFFCCVTAGFFALIIISNFVDKMSGLSSMTFSISIAISIFVVLRRYQWSKFFALTSDYEMITTIGKIASSFLLSPVIFFWYISDYGSNTRRIISWFFIFSLFFATVYTFFPDILRVYNHDLPTESSFLIKTVFGIDIIIADFIQMFFFAVSTMVTLGFGGINIKLFPDTNYVGMLIVTLNLMVGYFLLAVLVTRLSVLFQTMGPSYVITKEIEDLPIDIINKIVGENCTPICAWREYIGLSQEDLSIKTRIDIKRLRSIESGSSIATEEEHRMIVNALGIETHFLD